MNFRFVAILVAVALSAGCASGRCTGDLAYQRAESLPPPAKVEGLKLPSSPSALVVPPPPATVVPYAVPTAGRYQCLDVPPAMPPVAPGDEDKS